MYMYTVVFVTFIHSLHDFAWFALICYIKILMKKQVEILQTNIINNIYQSF